MNEKENIRESMINDIHKTVKCGLTFLQHKPYNKKVIFFINQWVD